MHRFPRSCRVGENAAWLGVASALTFGPATQAATVTLSAADTLSQSSFDDSTANSNHWSDSLVPSAGNDYFVSIAQLRTPTGDPTLTFAGDSLTIATGGVFMYKGASLNQNVAFSTGVLTVNNLILDGGKFDHASGYYDVFRLAGNLTVASASTIDSRQGYIEINSTVTGTGTLTLAASNNYTTTFTAANSFTGNTMVNAGATLILADNGDWTFDIGASGANNSISGAGTATLNGDFAFDLTDASTTLGDSWTIVDVSTLAESFGSTFSIVGFVEDNNVWSNGIYQFSELTGILSVAAVPEPGSLALLAMGAGLLAARRRVTAQR